jgi:CBS domain-containing protein
MNASTSGPQGGAAKPSTDLSSEERAFFRDRLREARYAALADAEGFSQMCFAIEGLGKRLNPKARGLADCHNVLKKLAQTSALLPDEQDAPRAVKHFRALFTSIRDARNDAMHTGAYARQVAADAVTLCLVLEDALMVETKSEEEAKRLTVGDFMVSSPVVVHHWQTVEHARQLMLLNSFSYLPIMHDKQWWLIADIAVAQYLRPHWPAKQRLKKMLEQAQQEGLVFMPTTTVERGTAVTDLLNQPTGPGLWLVRDPSYPIDHLVGVLSPFELI